MEKVYIGVDLKKYRCSRRRMFCVFCGPDHASCSMAALKTSQNGFPSSLMSSSWLSENHLLDNKQIVHTTHGCRGGLVEY